MSAHQAPGLCLVRGVSVVRARGPGCSPVHYREQSVSGHPPFWVSPAGSNCSVQSGTQTQTAAPACRMGSRLAAKYPLVSVLRVSNESDSFQNESKDVRVPESFEQSQNWRGEQEKTREQRSCQEPFHLIIDKWKNLLSKFSIVKSDCYRTNNLY